MKPQVGHHVLTTRPQSPLRPPGPPWDHLARCWPHPSLITTPLSSLPLMTALSRVWRLRITDGQQLGPPAAHQHPEGLEGVMMLCLCLREGGRRTMRPFTPRRHHFADKHWCSNHSLCLAKPKPLPVHNTVEYLIGNIDEQCCPLWYRGSLVLPIAYWTTWVPVDWLFISVVQHEL